MNVSGDQAYHRDEQKDEGQNGANSVEEMLAAVEIEDACCEIPGLHPCEGVLPERRDRDQQISPKPSARRPERSTDEPRCEQKEDDLEKYESAIDRIAEKSPDRKVENKEPRNPRVAENDHQDQPGAALAIGAGDTEDVVWAAIEAGKYAQDDSEEDK